MKPFLLFAFFLLDVSTAPAQRLPPTIPADTGNLALLAKVWGFLKYYHPVVASGSIAWDDELLHFLPVYRRLKTDRQRCDSLLAWIDRQGAAAGKDTCSVEPPADALLTPDFSWMDDARLSPALRHRLQAILRYRNTGPAYYIRPIMDDGVCLPLFQHEASYPVIQYPDSSYGLLCLFRLWNAIEYWYPYKYHLEKPWPEVLTGFIPRMNVEANVGDYARHAEQLLTQIADSHGYLGWVNDKEIHGSWWRPFTVAYVGRWVVSSLFTSSLDSAIRPGDILDSIDGTSAEDLAAQLAPQCPASNRASLLNKLSRPMIQSVHPETQIVLSRNGSHRRLTVPNIQPRTAALINSNPAWFPYPKDSAYATLPNNILYLNMGLLKRNDSARWLPLIKNSTGLIIDARRNGDEMNGTNAVDILLTMILPAGKPFYRFSTAVPSFPGVFRLLPPASFPLPASRPLYNGKIAILVDVNSTSIGEFMAMAFRAAPKAVLVGSPTAGADGNVNLLALPGGGLAQFSGLGVYHPDGSETQRTGLHPDIHAAVNLADYLAKRDLALEKALLYLNNKH